MADKYLVVAMTNAIKGREEEFNRWYDEVAIPVYRSLPNVTPLGRFKATDLPASHSFSIPNNYQYLSLYLIETDDFEEQRRLMAAAFEKATGYYFSEAIDQTCFFEPMFVALGDTNFEPLDRFETSKLT